MATPSELSLEEIRKYLLENGGSARNHDLVKYFKKFLTDPETRVESRNRFKEYVNTLAAIKNEDGEKYLVLKKKYRLGSLSPSASSSSLKGLGSPGASATPVDFPTPISSPREPPPYRPPPVASPTSNLPSNVDTANQRSAEDSDLHDELEETEEAPSRNREYSSISENTSVSSPPIPPRRKSQDKLRVDNNKENVVPEAPIKEDDGPASATTTTSAEQLSVRERMQRFNKMASETDLHGRINGSTTPTKKRSDKGTDDDDRASVASQLDGKSREWLVRAAQGDYQALAKLAAEEPRLARLRDPSSGTALHWGAKHGNEDIVKLIAGTHKDYIKGVNETTNGGYTPLHIAMQFDHENIFNLLVQVYGANQELRDHSGKKARQYLASQEAAVSQDTFRKIKARKKHAEKDLGFLRIGSLNVRVKRTTEAFSQFLGVASSNVTATNEKIHKTWGSADNIQTEHKVMPPPKYAPIKKRRSKRAQDFSSSREGSLSNQVNTNPQPRGQSQLPRAPHRTSQQQQLRSTVVNSATAVTAVTQNDSDSDNACGFDSAWRGSALL
ncbi:ankyrin repeat domain-containing protein SOWAHC isoform X1 [Athalia rosae]|uniref:ankyrin repeat domain-containing protein SOWAHC isoform X1 n=1 Tax=Athalia rosae TaxID=37344 RepID=UPI0020344972|nr:ankyrin repeat domain-containing protein SOWAHC isoform X1 [Athalia rosae]